MDEQEKYDLNETVSQPTDAEASFAQNELEQEKAQAETQVEQTAEQAQQDSFYSDGSGVEIEAEQPSSTAVSYYDNASESGYSPYAAQPSYNYSASTAQPEDEKKKSDGKKAGKIILCIAIAAIVAFCGAMGAIIASKSKKKSPVESKTGDAQLEIVESKVVKVDESDGLAPEEIYSKNIQSNVGIILYGSVNSLFSSQNSAGSSSVAGEGSGIIMSTSSDGSKTYIITCAHVIEAAKTKNYKVVVQDYNGEQYDATVVGFDSKTDIGVLSIEGKGFSAAQFGDSSQLKIGETVYAIGNPGGTEFFGSYTKGMISAIDRPVSNEIGYDMKCIQHDAAINPGNSGGMLINSAGQVIGINSSKIASTEYEGMGFAIPISSAKQIIDDIIANGYVTDRPKLGIKYAPVSQYQTYAMIAHYNKLPAGSLIIAEISAESAFSGTDAKEGDLIIAVNGQDMETADTLLDKIENGKVGDKLKLTLCRIDEKTYDVKKFDVEVTLIEDKGTTAEEEQQQQPTQSYEDFFNQFFGNGGIFGNGGFGSGY